MGRASKRKGANGEREFCSLLGEGARNLDQTREGGLDVDLDVAAIEVKRAEAPAFGRWITQTLAGAGGKIPVLAWRASRRPWLIAVFMDMADFRAFLEWKREQTGSE